MDLQARLRGGKPLDEVGRSALQQQLPGYLETRRWFAGKGRAIASVEIADDLAWQDGAVLLLAEVRFADGGADSYLITVRREGDRLVEALDDPGFAQAIREVIASGLRVPMRRGALVGHPTPRAEVLSGRDIASLPARLASAEQSNTNVLFGDRLLLKFLRRPAPGPNPEVELGTFLTGVGGERITPWLAGSLAHEMPGGDAADLGVLSEYVPNEGSGWDCFLGRLRDWLAEAGGGMASPPALDDPDIRSTLGPSLADARTIGRATARLHRALSSRDDLPDFAPEPLGDADWEGMKAQVRDQWDRTRALLLQGDRSGQVPGVIEVLEEIPRRLARWEEAGNPAPGSCRTRCHGDYHLGQTLMVPGDALILDFEGEPGVPLDRRRAKQSPYRDVAGMLRSISYAAGMVGREAGDVARPWIKAWKDALADAFLRSYDEATRDARFFHDGRGELIGLFWLEKALYEVSYELANRPDWVGIPLGDLVELARGEMGAGRG